MEIPRSKSEGGARATLFPRKRTIFRKSRRFENANLSATCNADAMRPLWPAFGGNTLQRTVGDSNYNALEASIHYTRGASDISAGYTCAKSIDQSSNRGEAVNPFDLRYTRAISAFDVNTISFHHVQIRDPFQAAVWPRKPVDRKLVHFRRYTIQHRFARDALQRSRRFAAGDKSKRRKQSVSGRAAIHAATAGTQ